MRSTRLSVASGIAATVSVAAAAPARVKVPRYNLSALSKRAAKDQHPIAPRCFAYSKRERAFACVGHDEIGNRDHVTADDQATNVRIDVIGPSETMAWTSQAIGGRETTPAVEIEQALQERGMLPLTTRAKAVALGTWTQVGSIEIRLELRTREGDASYENFGELQLRCGEAVRTIDLRARGVMLGDRASIVVSPDAEYAALGIGGDDGGEGAVVYSLDTTVIALATVCAAPGASVWTTTGPTHSRTRSAEDKVVPERREDRGQGREDLIRGRVAGRGAM